MIQKLSLEVGKENLKIKEAWSKNYCWRYPCSDGWHDSFWKTIIESPQWEAWSKIGYKQGFDVEECRECGWLSQGHFQSFIKFIITQYEEKKAFKDKQNK